jgi:hypothetical protein
MVAEKQDRWRDHALQEWQADVRRVWLLRAALRVWRRRAQASGWGRPASQAGQAAGPAAAAVRSFGQNRTDVPSLVLRLSVLVGQNARFYARMLRFLARRF